MLLAKSLQQIERILEAPERIVRRVTGLVWMARPGTLPVAALERLCVVASAQPQKCEGVFHQLIGHLNVTGRCPVAFRLFPGLVEVASVEVAGRSNLVVDKFEQLEKRLDSVSSSKGLALGLRMSI